MKSRTLMFVTAMTLCAALALPLQPAAQHTRYRLIDIGTLGGTFGFANAINNKGWVSGGSNHNYRVPPKREMISRHARVAW